MDKIGFEIVWCMLSESSVLALFPNLGVAFTKCVQALLFRRGDDKRVYVHGSARVSCTASNKH